MKHIGIVGAGIAGLHLGLFLQQHNVGVTLYSERTPAQIRASHIANLVLRFDHTRQRERTLGVDHWDFPDFGVYGVHMYIGSQPPIQWSGALKQPASGVDMRIYQATLLEDFAARGGKVVVGAVQASDLDTLADHHDLLVVASGRGSLTELFPRLPERSPFTRPQRLLTGGFYRGIDWPEPTGAVYNISPGNGEIFQAPFYSFAGRVSSILIEGIPGQAFDGVMHKRYEDNPKAFEAMVLDLLREHAPPIYTRVNLQEFGVTRAQDVLQGAITPIGRRGYAPLANGKFVLAVGDVHILNDPVLAQGANLASRCAWVLGAALIEEQEFNEEFCREVERRLWEAGRAATLWTNLMLQPPEPHVLRLLAAAAQNRAIADELTDNFNLPEHNWEIFGSAEGAERFLKRHGWQPPEEMEMVA
jgi:2-polyprenyl-6-methoxyphenol hydroxylase-like FAD-dependent oxidoreductase